MTNKEWIELFFSESFEKQINDLILEDWDYEIPRDSILNYANHILSIPYIDYINYTEPAFFIDDYDFPKISIDRNETIAILDYFLQEDNRGLTESEVGHLINRICHKNYSNVNDYGAKILNAAQVIGLVYEYFGKWYLNCLAYVFDELSEEKSQSLISRMILRNKAIASITNVLQNGSSSIFSFFCHTSDYRVSRSVGGICSLLNICRKEGEKEEVYISYLKEDTIFKTSQNITSKSSKLYKNIERNALLFDWLDDYDLFDGDLNVILTMNGFIKSVARDLNELESIRYDIHNQCPVPNLREGERINKQLIDYAESLSVSYVTYDSSWRDNEYCAYYNPAVNNEFLQSLLPHQIYAKHSVAKEDDIDNQYVESKIKQSLPVTDLDLQHNQFLDNQSAVKENDVEEIRSLERQTQQPIFDTDVDVRSIERIKREYYKKKPDDFSYFLFNDKGNTIDYNKQDDKDRASQKTIFPYTCCQYTCYNKKRSFIITKKKAT